jgi:hypothetical protein
VDTKKYLQIMASPSLLVSLSRCAFLQGDAIVSAILKEQSTIDLAFVEVLLLVSTVYNVRGASWLLENTDLELASARKIGRFWSGDGFERLLSDRVVDCNLAVETLASSVYLADVG